MNKSIYRNLILPVALLATTLSAQVYELTEQGFHNPEFRARFAESYIAESDINPNITAEEKGLLDEIVPLVDSDPRGAIARLRSSISAESSAAFDFILGNLLYQEGDMAIAAEAYSKAIDKFPKYFRAHYNLGRAYVAAGDYAKALTSLQRALSIQAGDGTMYGLIGYCYINLDQPSTALDAYRNAIMLAPGSRDWRQGKLQCLVQMGEAEAAIALLYEFIEAEPEKADWWKLQANQFLALGDKKMAAANLSIVRDLGEADGPTLSLLGDLMLNEGLVKVAMDNYLAAIDMGGARPSRMIEVVNSLVYLDDLESAKMLAAKVENSFSGALTDKQGMDLLNIKARLAMNEDDMDGAAEFLGQIVERDPLNGGALLTLADLEKNRGDLAKAEYYAESASKIDAFAHKAYLSLAQLNVSKRDYRSAAKYLREAQSLDPKDYVADYLLRIEQAALRM